MREGQQKQASVQQRRQQVRQGKGVYLKGYTMEPVLPDPPMIMPEGRYLRSRVVD